MYTQKKKLKEILRAWLEAGERDEDLADLLDEVGQSDLPLENPWESQ